MIPDLGTLITAYLAAFNVVPVTPSETDARWVRLTADEGGQADIPDHVLAGYAQLDCYAGNLKAWEQQAEASLLSRQVRAALVAMPDASHTGAVVTDVRIASHFPQPDEDFDPARWRYIITADVVYHPA